VEESGYNKMEALKKVRFDSSCTCGCGGLEYDYWADEECLSFSVYQSTFYTKQGGAFKLIWHRIKLAWFALIGKEYRLYEGLLENKEIGELRDFLISLDIK
jgi:hypothetical protein